MNKYKIISEKTDKILFAKSLASAQMLANHTDGTIIDLKTLKPVTNEHTQKTI